jgi:hypothetical protein
MGRFLLVLETFRARPQRGFRRRAAACGLALGVFALALPSVAAPPRRSAEAGAAEAWFDPTQLPTYSGTIDRFLIDARGRTDGVLLKEGPQIILAPALGQAVRAHLKAGDAITVFGVRARDAPVITALAAELPGRPIALHPGLEPPRDAAPASSGRASARTSGTLTTGKITRVIRDADGALTGAVLEDGTIVRLPRQRTPSPLIAEGRTLAVRGDGYAGPNGRAIAAREVGPSPTQLTRVGPGCSADCGAPARP